GQNTVTSPKATARPPRTAIQVPSGRRCGGTEVEVTGPSLAIRRWAWAEARGTGTGHRPGARATSRWRLAGVHFADTLTTVERPSVPLWLVRAPSFRSSRAVRHLRAARLSGGAWGWASA